MFPSIEQIQQHSARAHVSDADGNPLRAALWKAVDRNGVAFFYHLVYVPEVNERETRYFAPADHFCTGYSNVTPELLNWDVEWIPLLPDGSLVPQTNSLLGVFYLGDDNHVRYQRKLADGSIWHRITISPWSTTPRTDVIACLGENERQYLPEDTEENNSFLWGLMNLAQQDAHERHSKSVIAGETK